MNFTLFTAVFLCIGWIVEVAGNERPTDCCRVVTNTRIHVSNIVKHSIQEPPICPIRAVRFYTKKHIVICSDPNSDWAKQTIVKLSPTTKPVQCSTTKAIQTTTHKTPGTHSETSTSTTVQPTVTVINTSGPETSTSTTITTSRPETSRSTTVTTIQTSQPKTKKSIRRIKPSEIPPQISLSTITCETGEPMTPTNEKTTPGDKVTSTTPARRTKPSRLKLKARKKSKKEFRKLQMKKPPSN